MLAGPNGCRQVDHGLGDSQSVLGVREFVNADQIAAGLSGFAPETAAIAAGEIMLRRIRELANERVDFAFETTLASRSLAPWLRSLINSDYEVDLVFVWLPSAEVAVKRVAQRVGSGGHNVPEDTIRSGIVADRAIFSICTSHCPRRGGYLIIAGGGHASSRRGAAGTLTAFGK